MFGHDSVRRPIIKERSLAYICPELIEEWHPTLNGYMTPFNVLAGSKKKAWWRCKRKKRHVWESVIKARRYGSGCPDCYDERQLDIRKYPKQLALFDYKHKKNKFIDPAKTDFTLLSGGAVLKAMTTVGNSLSKVVWLVHSVEIENVQ